MQNCFQILIGRWEIHGVPSILSDKREFGRVIISWIRSCTGWAPSLDKWTSRWWWQIAMADSICVRIMLEGSFNSVAGKKFISNFLWIFCDVRRMKRVETLKCLPSIKGLPLNVHVVQNLDWKYLDFRRINDAIYIKTHKWVFQLRQT